MRLVLFQIAAFVLVPCSLQAQTADPAPPADDLASAAPQQNPVQPASVLDFPIEKIAGMSGGCAVDLTAIDTAAPPQQAAVHVAATPVAAIPASATVTAAIK
jgi:hypothetical protein